MSRHALVHEAFRVQYYGDWLPNTYYLKVAGREGLFDAGLGNAKGFFATYTVAFTLAAVAGAAPSDRRLRILSSLIVFGLVRLLFVGPDIFPGFRFLAPYVPLLLVVAGAAVCCLPREPVLQWTMAGILLAATVFNAGVSGRAKLHILLSQNGLPRVNTITGGCCADMPDRKRGSRSLRLAVCRIFPVLAPSICLGKATVTSRG